MRVLFFIPPHPTRQDSISDGMPLGVLYLAACLEHQHDVRIVDYYSFPDELTIEEQLVEFVPDIVCISIPFKLVEKTAISISRRVRENSNAKIIIGGIHASLAHERLLKELDCDYFVIGEGESVIESLINLKTESYGFRTIRTEPVDIHSLPFPARTLLRNRQKYSERLLTSRGCNFNCAFCSSRKFWGEFRGREPDSIIDEMLEIYDDRGLVPISFADDSFTIDRDRVIQLCDQLSLRSVSTGGLGFSSHPSKLDEELLEKMRGAGFDSIFLGLESSSEKVLMKSGKYYDTDRAGKIIRYASGLDYDIHASFMIGLPGQSWEDIEKTLEWIENLPRISVGFHIFYPFDGSPVRENPEDFGVSIFEDSVHDGDIDGEAVVHNGILSPDEILDMFYRVRAWQRTRTRNSRI